MNASEIGSNDWWLVVLSMPLDESLSELYRYRSLLLEATIGTPVYLENCKKITRVNDEIKRLNKNLTASRWNVICKRVLPPELYEEVRLQVRIAEDELKVTA